MTFFRGHGSAFAETSDKVMTGSDWADLLIAVGLS